MSNPCINCGRERVDSKTWKKKVGASVITYILTVCPDAKCQKTVDEGIARQKAKTEALLKAKKAAKLAKDKQFAVT